jgi:hypothetical protein
MDDSREQMMAVLRDEVVPALRELGFSGSFPHFRRFQEGQIDLLTFQFNDHGGSFVVEIAVCGIDGITTAWGERIPPKKISAHDLHPNKRLRLGSGNVGTTDSWFNYEPFRPEIYQDATVKLLSLIHSEAAIFWQAQPVA